MTLIERRGKADLMIFFALCALTLLFIYVLFYYIKPMLSFSYIYGVITVSGSGSNSVVAETAAD